MEKKNKKNEKRKFVSLLVVLLAVFAFSFTSAEFWACFGQGEVVNYCNDYKPAFTCGLSNGCERCMSIYDEAEDCYVHGSWPVCTGLAKECSTFGNGSATLDVVPPVLGLNSPLEGEVYGSRSFLLDFDLDERADVYYYDNINGRGRWTRVCSDCSAGDSTYSKKRSFREGFNDLTFRAVDVVGNEAFWNVTFFVDSKKPKVSKTAPKKGFADGNFEVQFSEDNPDSLIFNYGNYETGYRTSEVDLGSCVYEKKKYYCNVAVSLNDYHSQEIEYWFNLTDIADVSASSKSVFLEVDTVAPVLNNPESFWEQGEDRYNKYIYFDFNITEENFDEILYYDSSETRARWRKLCSRLRDGICEAKKSFRSGEHSLDIQIIDEAGNAISGPGKVEFFVN